MSDAFDKSEMELKDFEIHRYKNFKDILLLNI